MSGAEERQKRWALFEQKLRQRGLASSTIPKVARGDSPLRASFAQERLLFLDQLTPGSAAYNDHYALEVRGPLDVTLLGRVLDEIAQRHEVLRTTFRFGAAGEAELSLHDELRIPLTQKTFRPGELDFGAWVEREAIADAQSPFDLEKGPLSRATLLSRDASEHVLLFTIHHAVWDGWSAGVLGQELVGLYEALSAGRLSPLSQLEIQYADYAAWQRQRLQAELLEQKLSFWKTELADVPYAVELPTDRPRPRVQSYAGKTLFTRFGGELSARVDGLAKDLGKTPFAVLFAAYAVLLARYSGQRELVIATPSANRPHRELEPLIGCFVNTLPLRVDVNQGTSFVELVNQVSERLLRAAPHQDLPFEKLVEALAVERDLSRSPIAQTMFVLQGTPQQPLRVGDLTFTPIDVDAGFAKLDLTLNVSPTAQGYAAAWEYNRDLFDEETLLRMSAHYERLLGACVAQPDSEVWRVDWLSAAEREQLLCEWNQPSAAVARDSTLHALVAAQVQRTPNSRALLVGDAAWSYAEVLARAEGVARALVQRGARPGDLIGVFLPRDEHLVPALLGVLLVGAAYVPLDPAYPQERIGLILEDTDAKLVLTVGELCALIAPEFRGRALDVTALPPERESSTAFTLAGSAADCAYVIYTSGSTGRPKGVAIEHRNTVAFIAWALSVFQPGEFAGVLAATSVCFDLSIFEIFCTLCAGGTVILAENALALPGLPGREQVTLINTVPSAIAELIRADAIPRSVRTVNLAGEALPEDTVLRLYELAHIERVYNLYGPSETTTYSTFTLTTAGAWRPTIGRPIENTRVYVLDEHGAPLPLGVRGELYIGGAGVARGYVARPELSAERFLPDPFEGRGGRMYKTGDVARWLVSGELEYLGRNDHQVKLRGFRVELGEVEATLRALPHVKAAVVAVREDRPGQKQLVGYVVAEPDRAVSLEELRVAVGARLPEYMVPARLVRLETLPLSPNGKVDRKRLPAPPEPSRERAHVAPRDDVEAALARIWQEVLGRERVGVHDNFFELGGDSIAAMRMSALAQRAGIRIAVKHLFQEPTLEGLARQTERERGSTEREQLPTEAFPLAPIQRWFFARELPHPNHYNQSVLVGVSPQTKLAELASALEWTISRHSALRLEFERSGATVRQRFGKAARVTLERLTFDDATPEEQLARLHALALDQEGSLDLEHGALGRVLLIDYGVARGGALLIVLHHLVVDVVSWHVLLSDVKTAYQALVAGTALAATPREATNYARYVERLSMLAATPALARARREWASRRRAPSLPRDLEGGANLSESREVAAWAWDAARTQHLARRAREAYRVGVEDVTLAALCLALRGWSGQPDIVVDVEKHGRDMSPADLDLSDSVGWFTSLFPLVFSAANTPRAAIIAVKDALHAADELGSCYPLLRYGDDASAQVELAHLDGRDVVFNFLGTASDAVLAGGPFSFVRPGSAATNHHPKNARSHLLEVGALVRDGRLELELAYSRDCHRRESMNRLLAAFEKALASLEEHLRDEHVGCFTRADFPLSALTQKELDARHAAWWPHLAEAHPLTAAQHAILVDVLRDPHAGYYLPQVQATLPALDPLVLERSLAWVLARHTALRTGFEWRGLAEPLALVFERVACPVVHEDLRGEPEGKRRALRTEFLERDRARGFVLREPPLLRLLHLRWTDSEDVLVFTFHHAIVDGWSVPLVVGEVLTAYAAFSRGDSPQLPPAPAFREYVAWFLRQDQTRAEAHFAQELRGSPALDTSWAERGAGHSVESVRAVSRGLADALESVAKSHAVTLGSLLQAAWAVVLARYGGSTDVVFGSVDAGRPDTLARVSEMVGMFVTTLPLRVRVEAELPVARFLQGVQRASAGIREHGYAALARLVAANAGAALFQSICVIENYPSLGGALGDLTPRDVSTFERTTFALTATASLHGPITLEVSANLTDPSLAPELVAAWYDVLDQLSRPTTERVGDIQLERAERRLAMRRYWDSLLADAPSTWLRGDRPRRASSAPSRARAELRVELGGALRSCLSNASGSAGQPPERVVLACLFALVARYTAQAELLIGVELEPGRQLPVCVRIEAFASLAVIVRRLAAALDEAGSNYAAPSAARCEDRIGVAFIASLESHRADERTRRELELSWRPASGAPSELSFDYDCERFDERTMRAFSQELVALAEVCCNDIDLPLASAPYFRPVGPVPGSEVPGATSPGAPDASVIHQFAARARAAPDALALVSTEGKLCYAELARRVAGARDTLSAHGVRPSDLVCVHLSRSATLVVSILAILAAGAAFVPIDSATPAERVLATIEDSGARFCVVEGEDVALPEGVVAIDARRFQEAGNPGVVPEIPGDALAYLIYTSGSTGRPKGVMVEHTALENYMAFYAHETGIGAGDRLLQFASPSFDVSVEEIFGALCHGASLVLRPSDVTPKGLLSLAQAESLTVLSFPTAYWSELTRALDAGASLPESVRLVLVGGERAGRDTLSTWQRRVSERVRLLNMYGPTETTISATFAELTREAADQTDPPIGKPVSGAIALVVDADGQPVPVGVPGELLIGGRGLARGYLGRPELTAQKFTPSPFLAGRVYHTGDLVRWRADGQLEYLGRDDQQVKIRGFRVELGEVEHALRSLEGVKDVAVVLHEAESPKARLVAYVVAAATAPRAWREELQALPSYMVPSDFVRLERLPLNRSGKLDRKALPAPVRSTTTVGRPAATALESRLVEIWRRVLCLEGLGVDQNFFELGGHSLLATQVVARIQDELAIDASVRDLFEAPTIERLAARLHAAAPNLKRREIVASGLEFAPLSFAQLRLWFLDRFEAGSAAYNMPVALRLTGELDRESLKSALREVVRRHAVLRSVVLRGDDGQPGQRVGSSGAGELVVEALPAGTTEASVRARIQSEVSQPLDLAQGPLVRARLLALGADQHVLVCTLHHIVADGWSLSVFARELGACYRAALAAAPCPLAELPIQYFDYARWQRETFEALEFETELAYWRTELADAPLRLELPRKPRAKAQSLAGATVETTLPRELSSRVDALALELSATPFIVLLAAFSCLLARVSGHTDLVVGTPVSNRRHVETEDLIGLFVNTLVIRADLRASPTFAELVAQLRERFLRAEAHQELPFERLVDALGVERDLTRTPIFQVMFAMQNLPSVDFEVPGLVISPLPCASGTAKFDVTLNVEAGPAGYRTLWEYRSELFEASFVERLTQMFERLLTGLVGAPLEPCSRAAWLSESERQRVLFDWNQTQRAYPEKRVHELIEAQARRSPDALAVRDDHGSLSYGELERHSLALAQRLRAAGVGRETRVGVALNRSRWLVVALVAVHRAGAAYVPLDSGLPPARLVDVIEDAGLSIILSEAGLGEAIPSCAGVALLDIDQVAQKEVGAPLVPHSSDDLAYVMFTSGSTGRPKGVEVTQRALVNFLCSMQVEPGIVAGDVVLAATSLSFDIAGLELFLPLVSGASVYVANRDVATDGRRLARALDELGVSFFQATPATYRLLLGAGWDGAKGLKLLVGGEQLPLDVAQRLLERCDSLWNVYGPTETTIWSTCDHVTHESLRHDVSIGRPIANTQAYVLDEALSPLPVGVLGELYLGGVGLARGYSGRPDLTAERFLPNPFGAGRIYRTGDVARHLEDGRLECFGRVDGQVKLRGFRVELGEIETALRRHPDVIDAAAALQGDAADARIVAYVVERGPIGAEKLREFLRQLLPDYMLPAHFVALASLPTNANGKLDRKALPKVEAQRSMLAVAPRDALERTLVDAFRDVLRAEEVGIFDNFFELGGHSLLAAELVFRLGAELGRELPVKSLFESPTVAALAAALQRGDFPAELGDDIVVARNGSGTPWFCFPALAGSSAPYLGVISSAGSPVFLLESPGRAQGHPLPSVASLTEHFRVLTERAAPSGPVRLLGWSFGAVTAFETAVALVARGREVAELVLVDPALPGSQMPGYSPSELAETFVMDAAESLDEVGALAPLIVQRESRLLPADLFVRARDIGVFSKQASLQEIERRFSVYVASWRALAEYRCAQSYAGRTRILSAEKGNGRSAERWLEFLPQAELSSVDADHYTILRQLRELLR